MGGWRPLTRRLQQGRELRVLVPTSEDRDVVHRVIYDELVRGELNPRSRQAYIGASTVYGRPERKA